MLENRNWRWKYTKQKCNSILKLAPWKQSNVFCVCLVMAKPQKINAKKQNPPFSIAVICYFRTKSDIFDHLAIIFWSIRNGIVIPLVKCFLVGNIFRDSEWIPGFCPAWLFDELIPFAVYNYFELRGFQIWKNHPKM